MLSEIPRKSMVNTAELRQIFPLRGNTLRHVVEGDGRYPRAMTPSVYATSSYSTWIFYRGVSGFATDCPCDVWCRGLTTCLLHVGPPFGNRFLNTRWAVYLHFSVFWHMQLYLSWYIISFLALSLLLKYSFSYCFKYSCTKIFHRRSLCTFYWLSVQLEFRVTNLTVTS